MLRIVIADDETSIREGLAKMIDRESDRFCIAGSFSNGQEVLDFSHTAKFDVVITDIRMPLVDGLELIKELKHHMPDTRCIIMSGFTDFEYARQALRSSAVDYLLKPINKKQLFGLLYKLDEEKENNLDKEQLLRSGLLLSYLKSESSLYRRQPRLVLPQPYYAVTVLKGSDMEALRSSINLLQRQPSNPFDAVDTGNKGIILISYYAEPPQPEDIAFISDRLRHFPYPGIVLAGASRGYAEPEDLGRAYTEAEVACDRGMYSEDSWNYCLYSDEEFEREPAILERFAESRDTWIQLLQVLNVPQITSNLEQLFCELEHAKASRNTILRLCRHVVETAGPELHEWGKLFGSAYSDSLLEQLLPCLTFTEIKTVFIDGFTRSLQEIRTSRLAQGGKSVEVVKKWIAENYDQPVDLGNLASMVYLTPSYLSKLFKHETGMTITDYLIEVRIKKAKQLLIKSSELKIHEVGCEVGYPDPAYFNKLFKRMVGVTPNEYKKISPSSS